MSTATALDPADFRVLVVAMPGADRPANSPSGSGQVGRIARVGSVAALGLDLEAIYEFLQCGRKGGLEGFVIDLGQLAAEAFEQRGIVAAFERAR
jgi:hypothetical protein